MLTVGLFFSLLFSDAPFVTNEEFWNPQSLQVDRQNNLYILDGDACKVWIYSEKGELIRSFGQKGQGPGELLEPTSLGLLSDGRLAIADSGRRQISLFDVEGRFSGVVKITNQAVGDMLVLPADRFLLTKSGGSSISFDPTEKVATRFAIYALEGSRLRVFGKAKTHENPLLTAFLNQGAMAWSGDRLIFFGKVENELVIYRDGKERVSRYAPGFEPREPKADMVSEKQPDGSTSFQMKVVVDQLCTAMVPLPPDEVLLVRAKERAGEDDDLPLELVRMNLKGKVVAKLPGLFSGTKDLAVSADGRTAYVPHETEEAWVVHRLDLSTGKSF